MKDIKNYDTFIKIEPIHKGWSNDKKYYVETKNEEQLLLRISDISEYEDKKSEFDIMKKMSNVGINMSIPKALFVEFFEKLKFIKKYGMNILNGA